MTTNSSIKLGLIAFGNDGGLGAQTRRLAHFLEPDRILLIDSTKFSPNKQFHREWYHGDVMVTDGFPRNSECLAFLDGLTHVFTVENPYNFYLVKAAQERGIKVICQTNYEFCENVAAPWLPVPDVFAMPSYWKLEEMEALFPGRVVYLPPPLAALEFSKVRAANVYNNYTPKFIHIVGTRAWNDRNGTLDLLNALPLSKGHYTLTIYSQHELPEEYQTRDPRVRFQIGNLVENASLYYDADALILPRRYGGLSLTTNEALTCGIPVMMPDISPNNQLLPKDWLVPARVRHQFKARALIDLYETDIEGLAQKLDNWSIAIPSREIAKEIALKNFGYEALRPRYENLIS